jgi:DNA polymerase III delta prime subunit
MARLLEERGIPFERERMSFTTPEGHPYPFVIDFVLNERTAVFVNGCWWHACPECGVEAKYEKQVRNVEKDLRHIAMLEEEGFRVVVVWEHEMRDDRSIQESVLPKILEAAGVAGGAIPRTRQARVKSVKSVGRTHVLNISVVKNGNFFLANGILTHNTNDAQTALRRIMEEYSRTTRFVLTANYSTGIIEPIQSRCAMFRFTRLPDVDVANYLADICKREKVKASEAALKIIYELSGGDLRQAINQLQTTASVGEVSEASVKRVYGVSKRASVKEMVQLAVRGEFKKARDILVDLLKVYGMPETDIMKYVYQDISDMKGVDQTRAAKLMADYDFRLLEGAHSEIQLTALLAELSALSV